MDPLLTYFVDTGEGIEYHATEQGAKEAAAAVLKWCRKEAAKCGEWPDGVERICYGRIIGMVSEKVAGEYVDFVMEDVG